MIQLTKEEAQQVLDALEFDGFTAPDVTHNALVKTAIETLRARLAQPEQKPVAWMYIGIRHDGTTHGPHLCWKPEYMDVMSASKGAVAAPLYTSLPKPEHSMQPVAYVPVHPRNGPLWSMTTDAPSPERLPSYPMMSLYTAPTQRPWVGLTDEEVEQIVDECWDDPQMFIEVTEAKLKDKNAY